MDYQEFIRSKQRDVKPFGFDGARQTQEKLSQTLVGVRQFLCLAGLLGSRWKLPA